VSAPTDNRPTEAVVTRLYRPRRKNCVAQADSLAVERLLGVLSEIVAKGVLPAL
jgi:hypothetical protein